MGRPKFDFHTGWKEGGVYRESMKDGPMRTALERLWSLQRDRADEHFEALVAADIAADGNGKWWLRHGKLWGPSRFFCVQMKAGLWEVKFYLDGKKVYIGRCDEEEDAARLVDLLRVVVRGEAPENFPELYEEWLKTGGGVPAALVAAAPARVGRVHVSGTGSVEATEARAAASSSIEEKIDEAIRADPVKQSRALMKLSDWRLHGSKRTTGNSYIKGAKWNEEQGRTMERQGVETVRDLALVDVNNREVAMAFSPLAFSYKSAQQTLWSRKRAAAALLGVDIGEQPKQKRGRPPKQERTTKHQDALDVATRWASSRAGTVDEELATEYAEALAAVARRLLSKKGSGGDDGAEPLQKKRRTRGK